MNHDTDCQVLSGTGEETKYTIVLIKWFFGYIFGDKQLMSDIHMGKTLMSALIRSYTRFTCVRADTCLGKTFLQPDSSLRNIY